MSSLDHQQKALSRVYAQYRDKPKFVEWMGIVGLLSNQLEAAYCDIAQSYDIESAEAAELDVIGDIVDIGRDFYAVFPVPQFELGGPLAELGNPDMEFIPEGSFLKQRVSDATYRLLIKSKIFQNIGDATIDGIITGLLFILPGAEVKLRDSESMSFSLNVNRLLTYDEFVLFKNFDFISKPQGVKFLGLTSTPIPICFGDPYAQCGDPTARCTPFFV